MACTLCYLGYYYFSPIFTASSVIITYGINPFDICIKNPDLWYIIKLLFFISYIFSSFIYSYLIYQNILYKLFYFIKKLDIFNKLNNFKKYLINTFKKLKYRNSILNISNNLNNSNIKKNIKNNSLQLYIGNKINNEPIYLPEKSLFQNILITGTIGTGKTSSAMYPFTEQFISNPNKIPMLILDVKGNYYLKVKELCEKYDRTEDLIVLELDGHFKYNPLHNPHLKPSVLADRLKDILLLFSPNNSESYWLDKTHELLKEAIVLCRLYNNRYVTFEEIHKIITLDNYYKEKLSTLRELFINNKLSISDVYNLYSALNFFEKEFFSLDLRTKSILKSEVTRITNCFLSDYSVYKTFCPNFEELNFDGFQDAFFTRKNCCFKS